MIRTCLCGEKFKPIRSTDVTCRKPACQEARRKEKVAGYQKRYQAERRERETNNGSHGGNINLDGIDPYIKKNLEEPGILKKCPVCKEYKILGRFEIPCEKCRAKWESRNTGCLEEHCLRLFK